MPQRDALCAVIAGLPVVTIDVAGECLFCIEALQLACSSEEVEIKCFPVVFDRFAVENNMALGQDSAGTKRTELLAFIQDTCEAGVSIAKSGVGQAELCDGRNVGMLECIWLPNVLADRTHVWQAKMGHSVVCFGQGPLVEVSAKIT